MTTLFLQRFGAGAFLMLALGLGVSAMAQPTTGDADWKEADVPPPPAFDVNKLVLFEVSSQAALVYGIDPATVQISKPDDIVRYVMVASSASGARNVLYQGLRCATGEYKTYARYYAEGGWKMTGETGWASLFGTNASLPARRLAQAGACDGRAIPLTVRELVTSVKSSVLKADH